MPSENPTVTDVIAGSVIPVKDHTKPIVSRVHVGGKPRYPGETVGVTIPLAVRIEVPVGEDVTIRVDADDPRIRAAVHAATMIEPIVEGD